jgi:predicted RNA binding protein YcfA (HicA-like mRNA interferase family)
MPELPVCSGKNLIKVFTSVGWIKKRQKGSHVSLIKPGSFLILTIPLHKEIDRGLLRSLIRKSGLEVNDFISILKKIK